MGESERATPLRWSFAVARISPLLGDGKGVLASMITKNTASHSLLVKPACDLDALAAEHIRQSIRPLLSEGYRYVIFDMEETNYLTSAGLGLLVEIHNAVTRKDGTLRLINCCSQICWLLRQTKLDTILDTSTDETAKVQEVPYDSLHALMSQEILFCARINEVTAKSLKSNDPKEISQLILNGISTACDADRGAFYFIAEEKRLVLAASRGLDRQVEKQSREYEAGLAASIEAAIGNGDIEFLSGQSDTGGNPIVRILKKLHFSRAAVIPISGVERQFGFILLEDKKNRNQPLDSQRPLMRMFASICGLALEKTHLLGQFRAQNEDLQNTLHEVQKFQNTLVDVGKLASLGAVLSGLGHLLNNKLVPIIGYTQMLSEGENVTDKAKRQLTIVSGAAVELKNIMDKLIKVGKVREISHDLVDVNEVITKTLTLLGYELDTREVAVRMCLAQDLPLIIADHDLLLQCFLAAIHRACHSFREGQPERWVLIVSSNQKNEIAIRIEDNGSGLGEMSEEDWLDPLVPFTELEEGRLFNYSIPRSVVKRHRGTLTLTEKPEGGTIVDIRLPITRSEQPQNVSVVLEEPNAQIA